MVVVDIVCMYTNVYRPDVEWPVSVTRDAASHAAGHAANMLSSVNTILVHLLLFRRTYCVLSFIQSHSFLLWNMGRSFYWHSPFSAPKRKLPLVRQGYYPMKLSIDFYKYLSYSRLISDPAYFGPFKTPEGGRSVPKLSPELLEGWTCSKIGLESSSPENLFHGPVSVT